MTPSFPTFKLTASPDDFARFDAPPSVPRNYILTDRGIRRDMVRKVKLDPDSHHNATRRRARKLYRRGALIQVTP